MFKEKGDTLAYFVSRDDFNKLRIRDKVKYEAARFQPATIKRLLEATVYGNGVGN